MMFAHMTVRETLTFQATMRLPGLSFAQLSKRVDAVMVEAGLDGEMCL